MKISAALYNVYCYYMMYDMVLRQLGGLIVRCQTYD